MSYTSRSQIQINELFASCIPISFNYADWTINVEKTIFSKRIDVTDYSGLTIATSPPSGGNVKVRVYFGGTLVKEHTTAAGCVFSRTDISAYNGSYVVEIRLFLATAGGTIRSYCATGDQDQPAISVQLTTEV